MVAEGNQSLLTSAATVQDQRMGRGGRRPSRRVSAPRRSNQPESTVLANLHVLKGLTRVSNEPPGIPNVLPPVSSHPPRSSRVLAGVSNNVPRSSNKEPGCSKGRAGSSNNFPPSYNIAPSGSNGLPRASNEASLAHGLPTCDSDDVPCKSSSDPPGSMQEPRASRQGRRPGGMRAFVNIFPPFCLTGRFGSFRNLPAEHCLKLDFPTGIKVARKPKCSPPPARTGVAGYRR